MDCNNAFNLKAWQHVHIHQARGFRGQCKHMVGMVLAVVVGQITLSGFVVARVLERENGKIPQSAWPVEKVTT